MIFRRRRRKKERNARKILYINKGGFCCIFCSVLRNMKKNSLKFLNLNHIFDCIRYCNHKNKHKLEILVFNEVFFFKFHYFIITFSLLWKINASVPIPFAFRQIDFDWLILRHFFRPNFLLF